MPGRLVVHEVVGEDRQRSIDSGIARGTGAGSIRRDGWKLGDLGMIDRRYADGRMCSAVLIRWNKLLDRGI